MSLSSAPVGRPRRQPALDHAQHRLKFVDVSVGRDPGIVLVHPRPVDQSGVAVIARLGVDLHAVEGEGRS